jgi:predicted AAA+ superfamily ATPase
MIRREKYLKEIAPFIDKPFIKVISGMRRSGKSCILQLIQEALKEKGIAQNQIIFLNFDSLETW